jgi:UDP-2,3-diacylglucosamine pyrophosphatase LpxH
MAEHHRIHRELDRSFDEATVIEEHAKQVKWIIFSDHHRGRGDGADDFRACEETYKKALRYYLDKGYTLCLLGDVEEFWENPILKVMNRYKDVMLLEKEFYDRDRLHRIWGNHDDSWQIADKMNKYLGWLFPRIRVSESIVLKLKNDLRDADILLVHGHQGTLESDRFALISRFFVRVFWRNFQRIFKIPLSTPSNNIEMKSAHDEAMYAWADKTDNIIICGHTHHPVFMSFTHADQLQHELNDLEQAQEKKATEARKEEIASLRKLLLKVQLDEGRSLEKTLRKPLYFNAGCCSFKDGDITGLELSDGEIKLVKWTAAETSKKLLGRTSIDYILDNPEVEVSAVKETTGVSLEGED